MEYQISNKTYICSEPPILQKTRDILSSTIIILASVLGLTTTLILPLFFKLQMPYGNAQKFASTLLISDFVMFLPNIFLFLSAFIMCVKFKNQLTLNASAVSPLYFFITITPLTPLCIYYFEFIGLDSLSKNVLKAAAFAAITVLAMVIHIIAAQSIKTAIRRNLPKRAFVFVSALVFLLTLLGEAAYMVYKLLCTKGATLARFEYSDYIGTALFAAFTATSAIIITVKLISLYFSIGRVKKEFNQTIEENI